MNASFSLHLYIVEWLLANLPAAFSPVSFIANLLPCTFFTIIVLYICEFIRFLIVLFLYLVD